MDRATEYGEPIAYDAADRMEASWHHAVRGSDASSWPWA